MTYRQKQNLSTRLNSRNDGDAILRLHPNWENAAFIVFDFSIIPFETHMTMYQLSSPLWLAGLTENVVMPLMLILDLVEAAMTLT